MLLDLDGMLQPIMYRMSKYSKDIWRGSLQFPHAVQKKSSYYLSSNHWAFQFRYGDICCPNLALACVQQLGYLVWPCNCLHSRLQKTSALCSRTVPRHSRRSSEQPIDSALHWRDWSPTTHNEMLGILDSDCWVRCEHGEGCQVCLFQPSAAKRRQSRFACYHYRQVCAAQCRVCSRSRRNSVAHYLLKGFAQEELLKSLPTYCQAWSKDSLQKLQQFCLGA